MANRLLRVAEVLFGLSLIVLPLPLAIHGISLTNLLNAAALACLLPCWRELLRGQRLWMASLLLVGVLSRGAPHLWLGFAGLALLGWLAGFFCQRAARPAVLACWMAGAALTIGLGLSGFVLAIAGVSNPFIRRYENFPYFGNFPRILSTFANPTALNVYLLLGFLLAVSWTRQARAANRTPQALWLFNLPLTLLTGVLSLSKVTLFSLGGWAFYQRKKIAIAIWLVALIIPLGVLTTINPQTSSASLFTGLFPEQALCLRDQKLWWIPTNYLVAKQAAWKVFTMHPLTGVGLGGFPAAAETLIRNGELPTGILGFNPHSTYFGVAAESGVVGLIALTAWTLFLAALLRKSHPDVPMHRVLCTFWLTLALVAVHADVLRFPVFWFAVGFSARLYERA